MTEEQKSEEQVNYAKLQVAAMQELVATLREITSQNIKHEVEQAGEEVLVRDYQEKVRQLDIARHLLVVSATEIYARNYQDISVATAINEAYDILGGVNALLRQGS